MSYRKMGDWLLPAVALISVLVFSRGLVDAFELPKATVLWISTPSLLITALFRSLADRKQTPTFVWLVWALMALQIVSFATGIRSQLSLYGTYQRNLGLLTVVGVLSFAANLVMANRAATRNVVYAVILGGSLHSLYGLAQGWGYDPWEWSSPGQNQPIFGTMGNLNTGSFLSAITLCMSTSVLLKARNATTEVTIAFAMVLNAAAIGWFASFQGQVGLVICVIFLIIFAWLKPFNEALIVLILAVAIGVLGFTTVNLPTLLVCLIVVCGLSAGNRYLARTIVDPKQMGLSRCHPTIQFSVLGGFGIGILAFLFLRWDWITRELDASLLERRAFFSSAISNWRSSWLTGYGQDVFGLVFSEHRPTWHATSYEVNRTNSPHSIWLDFLLSGGLLSASVLLLLIVIAGRSLVRKLRSKANDSLGLMPAFFAMVLMAGVSVGHPVLYLMVFVVLALCAREEPPSRRMERSNKVGSWTTTAALAVASTLILIPILTKPVRADVIALDALKSSFAGDVEAAKPRFERALDINPGSYINRYRLIVAAFNQSSASVSVDFARETASLYRYLPSVSVEIAYYLASVGAFSESIEVMESTVAADPFAPVLKTQAADLFIQIGDIFLSREGGRDQARAAYSLAVEYAPDYLSGAQKLDAITDN